MSGFILSAYQADDVTTMSRADWMASLVLSAYQADDVTTMSRADWMASLADQPRFRVRPCKGRQYPTIAWTVGGNYVRVKSPKLKCKHAGGDRGSILTFSDASRRRLLRFVNSINRNMIRPERIWFLTLTYPGEFSGDPERWKRDLKAFRKRLFRQWGILGVIWKLEFQERGAPHFHLLLLTPPEWTSGMIAVGRKRHQKRFVTVWKGGKLTSFREWCSSNWYEVVGSGDERHLRAGTNVEPIESWRQAISYAAKYLGKTTACVDRETGECLPVGRFWGVWNRELWPIQWVHESLPWHIWGKVRRVLRKWHERNNRSGRMFAGVPHGQEFFAPSEMVVQLCKLFWPGFSIGIDWEKLWREMKNNDRVRNEPPTGFGPDGPEWNVDFTRDDYCKLLA